MRASLRTVSALSVSLVLAACAGGGSPTGAPASVDGTPGGGSPAAAICTEPAPGTAADVDASVGGNEWGAVSAAVGDVITWTNGDAVPHKVGLDDGSCTMSANITGDAPQSLVFNVAGSFPFHCTIHPSMQGTIVIS
jgi:plastocyanin